MFIVACATATAPSEDVGDVKDGGGSGNTDANYGTILDDGAYVPPGDAALHGGIDAGPRDSGPVAPKDSGTVTPPASDECPSGNTTLYDFEWAFSSTTCTPGNGDCSSGDCCFDRGAGAGDPYCIAP